MKITTYAPEREERESLEAINTSAKEQVCGFRDFVKGMRFEIGESTQNGIFVIVKGTNRDMYHALQMRVCYAHSNRVGLQLSLPENLSGLHFVSSTLTVFATNLTRHTL